VKPYVLLALFFALFFIIVARIRTGTVENAGMPALLPAETKIVSAGGKILAYPGAGYALLCRGGCIRIYGSSAPNGSVAQVLGVWSGNQSRSLTVVRESWTRS
jgi:hypothetical protein